MKLLPHESWLREKYWDRELSLSQIARLAGVSETTIFRLMKCYDIPRRSKSGAMKGTKFSLEHRQRISEARKKQRGDKNPNWKGGWRHCSGYVLIYAPNHPRANNGCVYEHRLVMEKLLERFLEPGEIVHHKNGIKDDNRPENLELFSGRADHSRAPFEELATLRDEQRRYWHIKTVSAYITIGLQILAIILIILTRGK